MTESDPKVDTKKTPQAVVEIKGLLGALSWGADDRVTRVALFTDTEELYEIEIDENNKALTKCLRKLVVVKGVVVDNGKRGLPSLLVMDFWTSA